MAGIPVAEEQKPDSERPAKAAGRSSRFKPKASAQGSTKEMGFVFWHGNEG